MTSKLLEIDQNKCDKCGKCLIEFDCPAIFKEDSSYFSHKDPCTGYAVCVQICPIKSISTAKE
jgi:indolepyruvate ferredoxin oxidoreductase alpha subunit